MSGLNLHERAEALDAEAAALEAALPANYTAEQSAEVTAKLGEAAEMWEQFAEYQNNLGRSGRGREAANVQRNVDAAVGQPADATAPQGPRDAVESLGQALVESDAYKAFASAGGHLPRIQVDGPLAFGRTMTQDANASLIFTTDPTTGGIVARPDREPGVLDLVPSVSNTLRSLVTTRNTTNNAIEYLVKVARSDAAQVVPEAQSAAAIDDGSGFPVGAVTPIVGGLKPEGSFALDVRTALVKTIAVTMPITRQAASDYAELLSILQQELPADVNRREDNALMNGTGGTQDLDGLLGGTWGIANYAPPVGETPIDSVLNAMALIMNAERDVTGIVAHPLDFYGGGFLQAKDAQGNYLLADPKMSRDQLNALWGTRVITTTRIPQGTMLVGDWRTAVLWDRQQTTMYTTDSHDDHFARNILDFLVEKRLAFAVKDGDAFRTISV